MMRVNWNKARVIDGRMSARRPDSVRKPVDHQPSCTVSPRPKVGSCGTRARPRAALMSCDSTPNTRISRMPMRKVGSEMPTRERVRKTWGRKPRRFKPRSEEHTSELQSLMRISYAVFCLKKKKRNEHKQTQSVQHVKHSIKYTK